MRSQIIIQTNSDIFCVSETHLSKDSNICIEGYTWYGNNRKYQHKKAKKPSGGVGMFVKNTICTNYCIEVIDFSHDGILALKFSEANADFSFVVVCAYLPPENSVWGRDACDFYSHILHLIYLHNDADGFFICGDLNSRFGDKQDTSPATDSVPKRVIIDKGKNLHGDNLLEFLLDGKLCIINGRLCPLNDNYTSVTTKGRSVVDYFITPHDVFDMCTDFKVIDCEQFINDHKLLNLVNSKCRVPDHAILSLEIDVGHPVVNELSLPEQNNYEFTNEEVQKANSKVEKRYKMGCIPENFLESQVIRGAVNELIEKFLEEIKTQQEVDNIYNETCEVFKREMENVLPCTNVSPKDKKMFKAHKAFWNNELKELWQEMVEHRRIFEKCKKHRRVREDKLETYKSKRRIFERRLRFYERKYNQNKMEEIDNMCTNEPNKFWEKIKNLGPRKNNKIPLAVYDNMGNVVTDEPAVLESWKQEYRKLYLGPENNNFDLSFFNEAKAEKERLETNIEDREYRPNAELNKPITATEVQKIIQKLKNKKAVGIDRIPNEVLKNAKATQILTLLFNQCFKCGIVPTQWKQAIIHPIPKGEENDPKIPLNYRGISLLSCISKVYTAVLNCRISKFLDTNNILVEEQNGFRKDRSCADHVFTLSSIVQNRLQEGKATFAAFLDLKKAFDYVNRELLQYKLLLSKIDGQMYKAIKALYNNTGACVKINDKYTAWFATGCGVRQGDNLSPTLFSLYINDMAEELKTLNLGIKVDDLNVSILLYADDIVVLAENEANLQKQLDCINRWCSKYQLIVNSRKSQIVHFRKKRVQRSNTKFYIGTEALVYTDSYRYLGIIFDEHLDFEEASQVLANAGGRALGSVNSKMKKIKNMGFNTYSKLYETGVKPILNYCSGIWGYQRWKPLQKIQNRAMRFYLGVSKFASTVGIHGELGWWDCESEVKIEMTRLWNRLVKMDGSRLTKKIFLYDYQTRHNNWSKNMSYWLQSIDMSEEFEELKMCNLETVKERTYKAFEEKWKLNVDSQLKLRTYKLFKTQFKTETYVTQNLDRNERSYLAQLRLGILPIRIETGRYTREKLEDRLCHFCNNLVEDEVHFTLFCSKYNSLRENLYTKALNENVNFLTLSFTEKLSFLFDKCSRQLAKYVKRSFELRSKMLFN